MVESRGELTQNEQQHEKTARSAEALAVDEPPLIEPETNNIHPANEPSSPQEAAAPMLDVHAPHEALYTWKGFFIHIATIVIGLLIAIGLEQTVEFFHHRHQVAETREALRIERVVNVNRFAYTTEDFHRYPSLRRISQFSNTCDYTRAQRLSNGPEDCRGTRTALITATPHGRPLKATVFFSTCRSWKSDGWRSSTAG
jgi:hypothetical protein